MKKKVSALLLATCMLCTSAGQLKAETLIMDGRTIEYAQSAISLYVNKEKVETTAMDPVQIEGRVLVPTREVFEAMKASVVWNGTHKTVTVKYKSTTVVLTVNKKEAAINGKVQTMDVPAQIINNKVMIPVRFVSEALGMIVNWDSVNRSVWISEPATGQPATGGAASTNGSQPYLGETNDHRLTVAASNASRTKITNVQLNEANGKATVTVTASSEISDVAASLLTGKVVLDVKNSLSGLAGSMTPVSNTYVKGIRTSQFTADTTRIVLDLKSGALVKVNLSADRTKLMVELSSQDLEELSLKKASGNDQLFFKGIGSDQLTIAEDQNNNILSFRIANMKISQTINWQDIDSNHISSLYVVQSGNDLVGTIKLEQWVSVNKENTTTGLNVILKQQSTSDNTGSNTGSTGNVESSAGSSNNTSGSNTGANGTDNSPSAEAGMSYVSGSKPVINLNHIAGLTAGSISITDNYRSKQLIFDLGKDYSRQLPAQKQTVNDGFINTIEVATNGTTKITVNTAQIYAYYLYNHNNKVQLQLVRPSEKYSQIVVLDIGHGGSDPGSVANNYKEKEINYDQGMALYRLLEADSNIKVYMTRETDVYPTLQFRATLANEIGADLFISIHNNSASANVVGTETLYYPNEADTRGRQIAQLIQNAIVNNCGMTNRGIKPRSDLYVLRSTNMTAVLIETGFISNAAEAAKISSPSFISTWAKSVYAAVVKGFELL